jgi:hypothetical protein
MRVLLAVDGSPYSETAVNEVAARVWPTGTEVQVKCSVEIVRIRDQGMGRVKAA